MTASRSRRTPILTLFLMAHLPAAAFADSFVAVQDGFWKDPDTWGGKVPVIDDSVDSVTIPAGRTVVIQFASAITLTNGSLLNDGTLAVPGSLTIIGGQLTNNGDLGIGPLGVLIVEELDSEFDNTGTFTNNGTFEPGIFSDLFNSGTIVNTAKFNHLPRCEFVNALSGVFENSGVYRMSNFAETSNHGTITNFGTIDLAWIDFVGIANSPVIANRGGTITNAVGGEMIVDGRVFNGTSTGPTSTIAHSSG